MPKQYKNGVRIPHRSIKTRGTAQATRTKMAMKIHRTKTQNQKGTKEIQRQRRTHPGRAQREPMQLNDWTAGKSNLRNYTMRSLHSYQLERQCNRTTKYAIGRRTATKGQTFQQPIQQSRKRQGKSSLREETASHT